ncbi:ADP-ribosylglycohydrolase family protein [Lacticaseibacillus saniviri]|uniref:Adp-ribosylglycohydrolase n=1 Tax=Lacticaseibacillus saniviri JCM 17471 = DSM 24301 TaxID=1293598 RepID=A0A0R2MRX3_9LACO|nr:ADP-ribosylglycohydrolase family protein [Lacticaseibacillus saniviri]KRO16340.1 adp-ribosylglycohydrolase [Lacticaseibacillus saniviri JCM 17471 = DSM 24301]MCG4281120.1 ADP-ribosylglycohydrolase family protein [Lacticaseibacillus saniviri]
MAITDTRLVHGVIGFAIGDALGLPVKGQTRAQLTEKPIDKMTGYGTFDQPAGNYSDETSLVIASMMGLTQGFDLAAVKSAYQQWYTDSEYAPYQGPVVDIWPATKNALTDQPLADTQNDPGGLTRVLPLAYFLFKEGHTDLVNDPQALTQLSDFVSLTNPDKDNIIAGVIYAQAIINLLNGQTDLHVALRDSIASAAKYYTQNDATAWQNFARLTNPQFAELPVADYRAASDPVSILEAVIWSALNTDNYKDALLTAVNLGGNTDTLGALVGGLAGLAYGYQSLPHKWCLVLAKYSEIVDLCRQAEASGYFPKYD